MNLDLYLHCCPYVKVHTLQLDLHEVAIPTFLLKELYALLEKTLWMCVEAL